MKDLYIIAVPLNDKGLNEVDYGNTNSGNVKKWEITAEQRNSLLQKILYQVALDFHIPYMDYDEETCIPAKSVTDINVILKSKCILFSQDWDIKGYSSLREAFELASRLTEPVYLFF